MVLGVIKVIVKYVGSKYSVSGMQVNNLKGWHGDGSVIGRHEVEEKAKISGQQSVFIRA
jgi:hypothetical protein